MIRLLLAPGSAAAANGITANVDVLLDAGAAGSAGDDFTVNTTIVAGAATGEGVANGLDESVALSVGGGVVTAAAEIVGADASVTVDFVGGLAPATGLSADVGVSLVAGEADGGGLTLPAIGDAFEGGFFAGLISHTADGVATHALIVAPRATGASGTNYTITTMRAWQSTTSATGATSPFDGAANTALMTNSPAANFCTGLSIGGYSDWYLPALYEQDIAYFHLKPTTADNITTAGINDYSVPKRTVNYTAGDPARTSVSAFQTGGAEAYVDQPHWSSTESSATLGLVQSFQTGVSGTTGKTQTRRVRAFRKIAL
jgi:hypothetical protein